MQQTKPALTTRQERILALLDRRRPRMIGALLAHLDGDTYERVAWALQKLSVDGLVERRLLCQGKAESSVDDGKHIGYVLTPEGMLATWKEAS